VLPTERNFTARIYFFLADLKDDDTLETGRYKIPFRSDPIHLQLPPSHTASSKKCCGPANLLKVTHEVRDSILRLAPSCALYNAVFNRVYSGAMKDG